MFIFSLFIFLSIHLVIHGQSVSLLCNNRCSYSDDTCCSGYKCVLSWYNVWSIPIFKCVQDGPLAPQCASQSEMCDGVQTKCCPNFECVMKSQAPGAKGRCSPIKTPPKCLKYGADCGGFRVAGSPGCCNGLSCQPLENLAFDGPATCLPISKCSPRNAPCIASDPVKDCCDGLKCNYNFNSFGQLLSTPTCKRCREEKCSYQADAGDCDGIVPSFYYDIGTGKCTQFIYSGCGGNDNRFLTKAKCEAVCSDYTNCQPGNPGQNTCLLQPDQGGCDALSLRWYYDIKQRDCIEFGFSECGGNANIFLTKQDCQESCKEKISPPGCSYKTCSGFAGIPCCDGNECIVEETYPDAFGYCRECSSNGGRCGGEVLPENQKFCCQGFVCDYSDVGMDEPGFCRPQECSVEGGYCKGFTIDRRDCCPGFTCENYPNEPTGDLPGTCRKTQECAQLGESCGGFKFPPSKNCCDDLVCGPESDIARDIPGTCMKPKPQPTCSTLNKACGKVGSKSCCVGLTCSILLSPTDDGICIKLPSKCSSRGQICSGFGGFKCCAGYSCSGITDIPNGVGICVQNSPSCSSSGQICGGIAGFSCCDGYSCQGVGNFPDASGVCIKNQTPVCPKICGGYANIQCCPGFTCANIDGKVFDGTGTCMKNVILCAFENEKCNNLMKCCSGLLCSRPIGFSDGTCKRII